MFEKLEKHRVARQLADKKGYSNKRRWALSPTKAVEADYLTQWSIEEMGLKARSTEKYQHWVDIRQWVKVA